MEKNKFLLLFTNVLKIMLHLTFLQAYYFHFLKVPESESLTLMFYRLGITISMHYTSSSNTILSDFRMNMFKGTDHDLFWSEIPANHLQR